jgi:hypothetical protein
MAWDAYGNYKKALRESKCAVCEGEE